MAQARRSLLPLTGVVFFILFAVGFIVAGETLSADEPGEEVISYFSANDSKLMLAALLGAIATIFFLFFVGGLRSTLRSAEGGAGTFSAIAFAGGVVAATGMLIFSGFTWVLVDGVEDFDPATAQTLNALNANFFFPLAGGLVTLLFATGLVTIRTAALPAWVGWLAIVIAVVTFTPVGFFAFLASIVWVLIVSIVLWTRTPEIASGVG